MKANNRLSLTSTMRIEVLFDDPMVVEELRDVPEDDRNRFINDRMRLGSVASQATSNTSNLQFQQAMSDRIVEQITELSEQFLDKDLPKSFGEQKKVLDKVIPELVKAELANVTQLFSFDDPNSPVSQIMKGNAEKHGEILEKLGGKSERERLKEKTPLGGIDFEDALAASLNRYSGDKGIPGDHVGKKPGVASTENGGRSCVGDYLLTMNSDFCSPGSRIVFEAKDEANYGFEKARSEIATARKNREAVAGVFVFSPSAAPDFMKEARFHREGVDVFYVWDHKGQSAEFEIEMVTSLAIHMLVDQSTSKSDSGVDKEELNRHFRGLEDDWKHIAQLQKWCRTSENTNTKKVKLLKSMEKNMRDNLDGLQRQIDRV